MQISTVYMLAVTAVQKEHGKAVLSTVGSTLYKALLCSAALDILAGQDDSISDERIRELLLMVHADIASLD